MVWDTAATGALELGVGAGLDAAHFITAVPTVIIYTQTLVKGVTSQAHKMVKSTDKFLYEQILISTMSIFRRFLSSPESQCHFTLMHRPLEQLNWVRGSQVGKAKKGCTQEHIKYNPRPVLHIS